MAQASTPQLTKVIFLPVGDRLVDRRRDRDRRRPDRGLGERRLGGLEAGLVDGRVRGRVTRGATRGGGDEEGNDRDGRAHPVRSPSEARAVCGHDSYFLCGLLSPETLSDPSLWVGANGHAGSPWVVAAVPGPWIGRVVERGRTGRERRTPLQAGDHQRGDQDDPHEQGAGPLRGVGQAEPRRPGAEQQHRDQGAAGVEPAVLELGGAEEDRGEAREQVRRPGGGGATAEDRGEHDARGSCQHPGRHEREELQPADLDSRQPRGVGVEADGVEASTGGRVLEEVPDADGDDGDVEHGQDQAL